MVRQVAAAPSASADAASEDYASLINVAGRQRMLSQRIILHIVLGVQGDAPALEVARSAVELFRQSHEKILGKLAASGFDGPKNLGETEAAIGAFLASADQLLKQAVSGARGGALTEQVQALKAQATPILEVLNLITQHCENLAKQAAKELETRRMRLLEDIQRIATEARIVSFNARVISSRAGDYGKEFAVIAEVLTDINERIERLAKEALANR